MIGPNAETGIPGLDRPLVEHVADAGDQSLEYVAKKAAELGRPIRLRLAISLWDFGQYIAWKGQTWRVEVQDKEEAILVQQGLEEALDLVARVGAKEALSRLRSLQPATSQTQPQDTQTADAQASGQETPDDHTPADEF